MHVEEHGAPNGTPIVFLHGAMVAGWMWHAQVDGLADHRLLVPDLPGLGRSGAERWISFADTADQLASVIRERVDAGAAHVVGLSLGGIAGLHMARRHPDTVRSLLVSGVPVGRIPIALRMLGWLMRMLYRRPAGARLVGRGMGIGDDEGLAAFVETAAATNIDTLKVVAAEVNRAPLPEGLEHVSVPTLAVVGSKDTAPARRAVPHLARIMPDTIGRVAPNAGHPWNGQQPGLFTDMVRAWVDDQHVDERLQPTATGSTRSTETTCSEQ